MCMMFRVVTASLLFLCSLSMSALAQCDSSFQFYRPDAEIYPLTPNGRDTNNRIDPRIWTAQWHFETQSDSTVTKIVFDDFLSNGRRIWLDSWCREKVWNWNKTTQQYFNEVTNAQLSALSRTAYMPVIAGDTIGFFRYVYWIKRGGAANVPLSKYVSDDVVSYSVELVRQSNGQRMALLGTFRISQSGASSPCVYSIYPLASKVRYIIPLHITDTVFACIRVNVFTSGGSNDPFTRGDVFSTARVRIFLNNPYFENFMAVVDANNACRASSGNCGMAVTNGATGTVNAVVSSNGIVQVKVFSQQGVPVVDASVTSWPSTKTLATGVGLFIVCGIDSAGDIVCTSTMMVQ